ncbi:MAG: helix-turn-helix domain-containing protein [Chloroflexi bacterium]|nr:helix-turn-helix domain-containing protein [Chloroflexota bacterium]
MDEEIRFVRSSGNVFADMGLPDADEQLAKAQIAAQVARLIAERDMTQGEIATMLGVTQPQVSALMRGRWEGVSLDKLFRLLKALDTDISITLTPKRANHARVSVSP